jgi:hypothetical protein
MEVTIEQRIKAKEIFKAMYDVEDLMGNYPMCFETAKQCAIIAVDRIISTLGTRYIGGNQNAFDFWYGIKDFLVTINKNDLND